MSDSERCRSKPIGLRAVGLVGSVAVGLRKEKRARAQLLPPSLLKIDGTQKVVEMKGYPSPLLFDLGGKRGNIVIASRTPTVLKSWRMMSINGTRPADGRFIAALASAHRNSRQSTVLFSFGEPENDDDMDTGNADAGAARLAQEKAAAEAEAEAARLAQEKDAAAAEAARLAQENAAAEVEAEAARLAQEKAAAEAEAEAARLAQEKAAAEAEAEAARLAQEKAAAEVEAEAETARLAAKAQAVGLSLGLPDRWVLQRENRLVSWRFTLLIPPIANGCACLRWRCVERALRMWVQ
jgi:hypothetical protein